MVIYKHEFDYKSRLITLPIEVEEKPKTYVVLKGDIWRTRISKKDIKKLIGNFGDYMYTLTPDNTPFIKALIEKTEKNISSLKTRLEYLVEKKAVLLKELERK